MADFVRRVLRPEQPDFIVRSLLDVDFYQLTMGLFVHRFYRGVNVKFSLINRHMNIPFALIIGERELREQLDHARTLRFQRPNSASRGTDLYYIRGMDVYGHNMFPEDFLGFLRDFSLTPYTLERVGDQYRLTFEGPWEVVMFWETIALAIINELFYRKLMASMSEIDLHVLYARATDKLYRKLQVLKRRPSIRFTDFGLRRRHSFLWQRFVVEMAHQVLGDRFIGTSNTWIAFNKGLVPIGTNGHALPMVRTALATSDDTKRSAQYDILRQWQELFPRGGLRIILPDTYGSRQFFNNMPEDLAREVAHNWRGYRIDSGDPIEEGNFFIDWLRNFGVDPMKEGKVIIPSDGLDVESMLAIDEVFEGRIAHPYGWGTKFTNDFEGCHPHAEEQAIVDGVALNLTWDELFRGHSIVCKVESANGNPAVKLSNNINKATGPSSEIAKYVKIFGEEGRVSQDVVV